MRRATAWWRGVLYPARLPLTMDAAALHSLCSLRLLREMAPRFCREAGVAYPAALLADGLPDGREEADPARGPDLQPGPTAREPDRRPRPMSLETLVDEWVRGHPDRKGAGLFFTPRGAARALLAEVSQDGWAPASVIDPAVGAGVFLLAAREMFGPKVALFGADRDPMAVAVARLALWLSRAETEPALLCGRVRMADAFELRAAPQAWPGLEFDLVCGNPPFGNAIEKRTALSLEARHAMARRFSEVARGPYDRSVLFVRLAAEIASPGGRIAFLVPRALLAARYATGLRRWAAREAPIMRLLRFPDDAPCADAAITMVGWIAGRDARREDVRVVDHGAPRTVSREALREDSWGSLLDPLAARIEPIARSHPSLGEAFVVRSGSTVGEAYQIAREIEDGGDGWRFLTTGSIVRYGDRWGERPARYLGRSLRRPVLSRDAACLSPARRDLYAAPKAIVCGLSRILRCRADPRGECAGSVGTFLVVPREEHVEGVLLRRITILLNSAWYSVIHRGRRGAAALSGGNVPLLRRDIEELPLPSVFLRGEPIAGLDDLDPARDDISVQRVILKLAGHGDDDARAIIESWKGWLMPHARARVRGDQPGR